MKKYLFITAIALVALTSCEKNNQQGGGKDGDAIELTASNNCPDMSPDKQRNKVLTLTWTAASNQGTGARVEYSILVDRTGGNFENAYELELGSNVTSYKFTAGELNTMIIRHFNAKKGDKVMVDMCIYASIKSEDIQDVTSNKVTIELNAFEAAIDELYMIGSATAAGWSLDQAIPMDKVDGVDGGFQWAGELGAGELKFLVGTDDWVPGFGREDDTHLYYREYAWVDENGNPVYDESIPHTDTRDDKFIITDQGNYLVVVNLPKMEVSITKTAGPKYFEMYMAGSAFAQPVRMYRSGYAFFATASNLNGNMHFSNLADDSGDKYYPAVENPGENAKLVQTPGFEWKFTGAENIYHISIYTKEEKEEAYVVTAQPYDQLYLIGNSCDAGWNIGDALPMTKVDAATQTWSGTLKVGELKFTCDRQSDWYGAWFLASTEHKAPEGVEEPMIFLDKSRPETASFGAKEFDQKWDIPEEGSYEITLNQVKNTVIIKKR